MTQCSTAESSVCGVCLVARNNRGQRAEKLRVLGAVWRLGINHRRPIHARHRKSPGPVPTNSHPNSLNGRRLLGGSGASGRQRLLSFACVRLASSCVRVVCSLCFRLVFYTHTVSSCCRVRAGRGLVPLTRAALCGESHSSYRTVRSSGLVSSGTTQHRPPDSTFHPASQRNLAFTPPLTSMDVKQEEQNGSCLRMVTRVPPVL